MASPAFDFACEQLEARSSLDRLESRGTIRLALKQAGLEAESVSPDQMKVVFEKVLPSELESRGIEGASGLCCDLAAAVANVDAGGQAESPDAVFARLGGS